LIVIGAGAYVAMEPEMIMDYVGPLLGESPAPQPSPPQIGRKPAPPKPAPPVPATQPQAAASAPSPSTVEMPQVAAPTPVPVPAPPSTQPTPMASNSMQASPPPPAPAVSNTASPTPLFSEGQRVSVLADPTNPGAKVLLAQDAEGTKSGPAIPPGTAFTILDGDLQAGEWVYSIRSDFGTKGWLAEKRLKLIP